MKNIFPSILLTIAAFGGSIAPSFADPLVTTGSSYSVYVSGSVSDEPTAVTGLFDGLSTSFTRLGNSLTLTESEFDLGGGRSRITIDVSAAHGDIFPILEESGIIGLGVNFDGLDFFPDVLLESAIIRFYAGADLLGDTGDLISFLTTPLFPWNGTLPGAGNVVFVDFLGGLDVSRFEFEFEVAGPVPPPPTGEVPEPGSLLLGGIALIAMAGTRLHRRRKQVIG